MAQFTTLRFGAIEVPDNERIEFARGLLGFEQLTSFVHLELPEEAPFGWLQSLEDPHLAFVVVNPAVFFPTYRIEVDPRELGDVRPGPNDRLLVLTICTIPERFSDISVNLLGPLVVNPATGRGKQLVLNRSAYTTHHRLTDEALPEAMKPTRARPRARERSPRRPVPSRTV
jgi:flagellar assembly factor FliW